MAAILGATAGFAQTPPESFEEEVVVRETSVAALPPGGAGSVPASAAVTVTVGDIARRVTRIEPMLEGKRGAWEFVIYLDPSLAGARTRYLAALALAQRAEALAAMGNVEVVVAGAERSVLERTDSWQRIEAALLSQALEAKHRLSRGDRATEAPGWDVFEDRLAILLEALEERGAGGPRALFLPSDGLYSMVGAAELEPIGRALAGSGWVTVPMPWSETPSESSAARLSEFESWKQSAEGRDGSAGTRQYVIDLGRVARRLLGAGAVAPADGGEAETDPRLAALQNLAAPTSGLLAARDGELTAALSNLARRWRIWFQAEASSAGEARPLVVRLREEPLAAPAWFLLRDE